MTPPAPSHPEVELDRRMLARAWSQSALAFQHGLDDHPLLSRSAFTALCATLPAEDIEHHLGDLPLLLPEGRPRRLDQSAQTLAEGIEGNGCWIMLSHLERLPAYAALRDQLTVHLRRGGALIQPELGRITLLLASPGATVPVHFDRHHNFLMQVSGAKTVTVGSFEDPRVALLEIERNFESRRLNAHRVPERSGEHRLAPGSGLYIPPFSFHWVAGGDDVSMALACTFPTAQTLRRQEVHQCNAGLRRLGLNPGPPGRWWLGDSAKIALLRAHNRLVPSLRRLRRRVAAG